jgi:hypothetical protein
MQKKLPLIIGGVLVLLLLVGGGIFAFTKMGKKPADDAKKEQPKKKKITEPANVIPVSDRPYVIVEPKGGNTVVIAVDEVKKTATTMDYELEYQTETNLEGAVGSMELATVPAMKDILLGSCSAGGACRYHKDVKGGTLLMKFAGPENYVLKQDWKYIENPKKETAFSSKNGMFQIESKDLASQRVMIIYNSPGYAGKPAGTVISDGAYVLSTGGALTGKASLTMRATEAADKAVIMGWNGKEWKEFATKVDGKSVTADVDLLDAYIVVKK